MDEGVIRRVLAQVEVSFSNSMIEAFWRSLRHQWLYLHTLESFGQLEQLIDFYVRKHNTQMHRRDSRMFTDAAAMSEPFNTFGRRSDILQA